MLALMKFAILLTVFFNSVVFASERITIGHIENLREFISSKQTEVGVNNILVVYDFDNTLMAMNQDLGSDQWYNWQSELIKNKSSKNRVAEDKEKLFQINYRLFALSKMHPTEKQTVQVVKDIQEKKIKSIILTSRGPLYRNDTEIELNDVGLNFKNSAIGPEGGFASTYLPENLKDARPISYMDGILMGSGQDKGALLDSLLEKTKNQFKVIVFVDDTLKNIENMENQLSKKVDLYTFYYTHEEDRVLKFKKDKSKAIRDWNQLNRTLKAIF